MDYTAWLVDLDGTLYRPRPLRALMAAELLLTGTVRIRTLREFRRQHELLRDEMRPDQPQSSSQQANRQQPDVTPFAIQLERTARSLGKPVEAVEQVVRRWMIERPSKWLPLCARTGLLHELTSYRAQGGRLALVSDYPARRKLEALKRFIEFDAVIANGEAGGPKRLKPDPEGYLLAAKALDVPPEQCLVVGDREDADGAAAAAAGMAFRWVR